MTGFIGLTGINKRQRAASNNNGGTFHCAAPSYRIKPPLAGPRALAGTFGNIDGTLPQGMTPRAYVAPEENPDHEKSLASKDPKLAANKRLVYDMWRTLLDAQQSEMARRLKTSRTQVARFLNPENCSVQLDTMQKAAAIVGKHLVIKIEDIPRSAA